MLYAILYRSFHLAIQFVAAIILANILLPAHFGVVSLMIINASILSIVTGLGSESIVIHNLVNKKWDIKESYTFSMILIPMQVLLFFLLQLLSFYITGNSLLSQTDITSVPIELIFFLGIILIDKSVSLLYPLQWSKIVNVILAVISAGYFFLLLYLSSRVNLGLKDGMWIFAIQTFLQGISLLIFAHFYISHIGFKRLKWKQVTKAFVSSLVIMGANLIQIFAYRIDFWFIQAYHGEYDVGVFAQANKVANLIWILPNIIALLLITRFSFFDKHDFKLMFKTLFVLNILIATGAIIAAYAIFNYFLSIEYIDGLNTFFLMLPGYFFWVFVIYYAAYFSWKGHFKINLIGSGICLLIIIILDAILIPSYSIFGAAIANTLAYSLTFLFFFKMAGKEFNFFKGMHSFFRSELVKLKELAGETK